MNFDLNVNIMKHFFVVEMLDRFSCIATGFVTEVFLVFYCCFSDLDWSWFDPELLVTSSVDTYIYIWDTRYGHKNSMCLTVKEAVCRTSLTLHIYFQGHTETDCGVVCCG